MMELFKQIKISLFFLLVISLLTGLLYPVVTTLIAQVLFPFQANGSIIKYQDKPIGSALIGQYFDAPNYFWGRPSATTPFPYNSASSSGSNMGPLNPEFLDIVKRRVATLHQFENKLILIPVDLVTASASGLDPEISPQAAFYQIPRIAKARNISEQEIITLVNQLIKKRTLYFLGEPRINVLELNLALDHVRTTHE
ncbi:potassium-transporting ATPase subunit KdpC [Legionella longbeachae]|uniref:Potassium-transporting ATPase KdpC subunit n=1 Tax=Legionella longbeachae serogroup 1 (strain NSW150) TaxID=661367 RepID=D3HKC6_LEGLN|nr:potassium-transporting ATPase subunit KdpC [Legionella longbeachae]VEE03406.1 potassium translocating ATPase, subunit C [Legionella oakridgensis]HBD7397683.1 potassium-transporting ATPase subunit KdpC [Legionella pneumophila]ARB93699.1 potassium-transporting ATPase subunit KdpC [Legionella longbeachae]ARM33161.1 potassium-transporting ATPase subunit KdpC [Legionella longbeachae]EEZ93991.1 potassium-transporting ATPase C subunit [Legionella longbeachae D-4968]